MNKFPKDVSFEGLPLTTLQVEPAAAAEEQVKEPNDEGTAVSVREDTGECISPERAGTRSRGY